MPSMRDILAQFSRDELLAAVDSSELAVTHRRVKDQFLDALTSPKRASLGEMLRVAEGSSEGDAGPRTRRWGKDKAAPVDFCRSERPD